MTIAVVATNPPEPTLKEGEDVPSLEGMMKQSTMIRSDLVNRTHKLIVDAIETYLRSEAMSEDDMIYIDAQKDKAKFALDLLDTALIKLPSVNFNKNENTRRDLPPPRVITKEELIRATQIALITEQEDNDRRKQLQQAQG